MEKLKEYAKIAGGFLSGLLVGIVLGFVLDDGVQPSTTTSQTALDELPAVRHTFSGRSQQRTRRFVLEAGLHTFEARYRGSNNFIVWLLNWENGTKVELLTNIAGADSVSKAFGIEQKGRFLLNVEAGKGDWEITIE